MNCVFLGEQVGDVMKACCGGQERGVSLFVCKSTDRPEKYACNESGNDGKFTIEIAGARRMESVAHCHGCKFRAEPVEPIREAKVYGPPKRPPPQQPTTEPLPHVEIIDAELVETKPPPSTYQGKCIHLGPQDGDKFECRSADQPAKRCVLEGTPSKGVAVCATCKYREDLAYTVAKPLVKNDKPLTLAQQLHAELRAKRNPPPQIQGIAVVDCDNHGWGDAIMCAWIAEGSKGKNPRLVLRTTHRRELMEMLGQKVVDLQPTVPGRPEHTFGMAVGSPPMITARGLFYGIPSPPKRPTVTIPEKAKVWAESRLYEVMLYPHTQQGSRRWPHQYWEELYKSLTSAGFKVGVAGTGDDRWKWCRDFMTPTWPQHAALMAKARLCIGNDSAPIHLAGTMNRKSIALLGRTTDAVFALYPSVRCLSAEKREVPCVGCWSGWGYKGSVCEQGCVALSHITPTQVLDVAKGYL